MSATIEERRAKKAAYQREYRKRNPEKTKAYREAWNAANPHRARQHQSDANRRWAKANPEKVREYNRRWRERNPDKMRDAALRSNYGITLEDYRFLLTAQGNACAICRAAVNGRPLDVDHCHTTGRVRGLLCNLCNTAIGKLRDDPELVRRAAEYLER